MKILFIDIDGPLIPDKMRRLNKTDNEFYKDVWHLHTHDPFSTLVLNNLFDGYDNLFGVLHSTWRYNYNIEWLKKHFIFQGLNIRWHDDIITSPDIENRWLSIENWLSNHSDISRGDFTIIDDEKPPPHFKSRTVRIDEQNGFSEPNVDRLFHLINCS